MKEWKGKPKSIGEILEKNTIVLKGADKLSLTGFTQIPNHILRNPKVSPGATQVYALLLSYAWHNNFAFPGQEKLAADMGAGLRSVTRYIKELVDKNFLIISRRGQGRTNVYTLNITTKKKRG